MSLNDKTQVISLLCRMICTIRLVSILSRRGPRFEHYCTIISDIHEMTIIFISELALFVKIF